MAGACGRTRPSRFWQETPALKAGRDTRTLCAPSVLHITAFVDITAIAALNYCLHSNRKIMLNFNIFNSFLDSL